jgi:hypothetical protein
LCSEKKKILDGELEDYHDGLWAGCLKKLDFLNPGEGLFSMEELGENESETSLVEGATEHAAENIAEALEEPRPIGGVLVIGGMDGDTHVGVILPTSELNTVSLRRASTSLSL